MTALFDCNYRSGNEEKLMALLTPLNVNCHASDGRKVNEALMESVWWISDAAHCRVTIMHFGI